VGIYQKGALLCLGSRAKAVHYDDAFVSFESLQEAERLVSETSVDDSWVRTRLAPGDDEPLDLIDHKSFCLASMLSLRLLRFYFWSPATFGCTRTLQ